MECFLVAIIRIPVLIIAQNKNKFLRKPIIKHNIVVKKILILYVDFRLV